MSPNPVLFKLVKPEKVIINGEEKEKTIHYKPQGLRWSDMKAEDNKKTLSKVIDIEKNYRFQTYSYTPHGFILVLLYAE